jgi:hypothetical protein
VLRGLWIDFDLRDDLAAARGECDEQATVATATPLDPRDEHPAHDVLEITLALPRELTLTELVVQAVWTDESGTRVLTDALAITLAP